MQIAMKQVLILIAASLLTVACSTVAGPTEQPSVPTQPTLKLVPDRLATIDFPVAMAMAPDGRLFITERNGTVQVLDMNNGLLSQVISLPTDTKGERGLIGIALDPNFDENHYIWIYHTAPAETSQSDSVPQNRIVRFTEQDGIGKNPQVAFSLPIPRDSHGFIFGMHNGGNLHFGPDGMLYVTIGDYGNAANSQNMNSIPGKIHRFIADVPLGIPDDNPFAGKSVYAMGLRNSFDFTFDPLSGALLATENGPECDDEINLIVPAGNYGWGPNTQCGGVTDAPDQGNSLRSPLITFTPTVALTGIIVYQGEVFPEWNGKLIACAWKGGDMYLATLNEARNEIVSIEEIVTSTAGCNTDLLMTSSGGLLTATANSISEMKRHLIALDMSNFEVGGQTLRVDEINKEILQQAGITWVKIQHAYEPGGSGFDPAATIDAAQLAGFRVMLSISGPPHPTEIDFSDFQRFLRQAASIRPDAIEIWEDMNLERSWPAGQISADNYVENMLAPAYETIKGIDSNIMVVSGGLAPTGAFGGCSPDGCDDGAYIQTMAAAGADNFMDCAGVHFTAGATPPVATSGHPFDGGDGHYSWYYSSMAELYGRTFSSLFHTLPR